MSMAGRRPMMSTSLSGSSLCRRWPWRCTAASRRWSRQEKRRYTPVHVSKRPTPDEFYRDNGHWENERSRLGAKSTSKRGVYVFVYNVLDLRGKGPSECL